MGLRKKILGDPQAVADHKAAKRELAANTDTEETPAYLAANDRVNETAKRVPWTRRG